MKIAIVQGIDGDVTCCGPDDFMGADGKPAFEDEMSAAICWHMEAGHIPAARYWVEVDLPEPPTIQELRAKAEAGEFPKSFIEEMDAP